ncbi:MAG TPA: DEAD/DEAH box helicase family protein, partial [Fimbriimonadaceae bacterium]|nr:DEAD/DEAH box helicase family protein [Fimbriimonadaceae bacterium]
MSNQNAEQKARDRIDKQLIECGWEVQDYASIDISRPAIAVREFQMAKGFGKADYLLYVDRRAVGVVEAKPEGTTLSGVEIQTEKYSEGLPPNLPAVRRPLPFLYQSTGVETCFTNALDPEPKSRDVFAFHRPETIREALALGTANSGLLISSDTLPSPGTGYPGATATLPGIAAHPVTAYGLKTLLSRLQDMPELDTKGMRDCQVQAILNLEESLAKNRRRSLIQMQTGSGKTYTAVAQAYRLIKYGGARRILFLVDRANLAKQTKGEFDHYVTPDDGRKFTELYNVQWLQSNKIDPVAKIVITTIQRLYSILQGEEELDPAREEESSASAFARFQKEPLPVVYNPKVPIETFDFVFTDECHRSIYNLWRQVLEYFDGYLIGLTATPSKQTLGFFHQNLVMEYGHAQAVADGVNVDFDVYKIDTRITKEGGLAEAGTIVDKRDRKSRKVRWEELDEDVNYAPNQLDKAIVVPDQIRTVVRTFRDKLFTEIFPGRTEVPKTLIFAKDDSHAEDIVRIIREEFGKGNDFCQKITYRTTAARVTDPETGEVTYQQTGLTPETLLSAFRNSYNPRIAVTVDMIATGTDVKPLEIVFFMRDVLSANYFEQMKGRGCRVITPTEFQQVTPDGINKDRYVIIDAVGVTDRERRQDSPPLEKQPGVPLKTVLQAVGAGAAEPEVVSTLAS